MKESVGEFYVHPRDVDNLKRTLAQRRLGDIKRCADAVARDHLPIRPGDIVQFAVSRNRLFVVAVSVQEHLSGSVGQYVYGLSADGFIKQTSWTDVWIDWVGLDVAWYIERIK